MIQQPREHLSMGVLLNIEWPLERIRETIDVAGGYGFSQVWVNEHPQDWDPFVLLSDVARQFERTQLGIGTINPWTRHPAVLAASAATVAATTGRHFNLGIGSGAPPLFPPFGIELQNVVNACREAILLIHEFLAGNSSTFTGEVFNTKDASLSPNLTSSDVSVFLGASGGPRMLELAGEVADGIIIPSGNVAFYQSMITDYVDARESFDRTAPPSVVVNGNVMVGEAADKDLESEVRQRVAAALDYRLKTSRFALKRMQVDVEDAQGWSEDPRTIPREVLSASAIWGDPVQCADGLNYLKEIGVTDFCLRFPSIEELRRVGDLVLPLL